MRIGLGLGLGVRRGLASLLIRLAGGAAGLTPPRRRWADASIWNDDLTWSDNA